MPHHADVKVDGAVDGVRAIVRSDRGIARRRENTGAAISGALKSKNEVVYFFLRESAVRRTAKPL